MEDNKPILFPIALPSNQQEVKGGSNAAAGGLGCMVGNCFAQTNGRKMTMTPSPFAREKTATRIGGPGIDDDKENSNIAAALEGIRAMKEVLSRNNSAHDLDVEVSSRAMRMHHNHVKPPRKDTPPSKVKVLAKIDNVLSDSAKVTPLAPKGGSQATSSSCSSAFTLQDEAMSITPPQAKSGGSASFVDMGRLHSSSSHDTTPVKVCDHMIEEVIGSTTASPTSMLAHSLFLKEQNGGHLTPRSSPSPLSRQGQQMLTPTKGGARAKAASQGEENREGPKPWHQTRVQMVASFVATIALFAVCKMAGGKKDNRAYASRKFK